ncbi:hypothetical protein B296_00014981 [Ensete ventricosum]|uniref:Homeobox-leucine zipper protein n=1 Tax=Ensete ventricosum TaxID=4639 RepID=A0A427B046_ENSVE|nr:hypothetical protein B296_00014981 [Ensete ventricosum]
MVNNEMMISEAGMSHEEEKMCFSALLAPELHPQMPRGLSIHSFSCSSPRTPPVTSYLMLVLLMVGETRVRRRRKKTKGEGVEGDAKKRRLSDEQVRFLEMRFGEEKKLECERKVHLAAELGLDPKQVAVWFQNRRARHKSKQVEEAYLKLKSIHDATVVEKYHLENEVLKLKDKLLEAEEEITKLSLVANGGVVGGNGGNGEVVGSPSSSTLTYQPLIADFGVAEKEAELMYIQEYEFNDAMMEWAYFYGM